MTTRQITIPMFPLNMVLLPGETAKLHIYEERYKQLVAECLDNQASFGIPFYEKGKVKEFGCEVTIKRVLKTFANGEMEILIEGSNLFHLLEFSEVLSPKLYGAGLIEYLPIDQKIILNNLQDAVVNYFGTVQNKFIDYETVSKLTVFNVAASLQLTNQEKFQLISNRYPQLFLLNQIKFIVHIINTEQQIKDRFIEN
jgi:Lon protease-like protein